MNETDAAPAGAPTAPHPSSASSHQASEAPTPNLNDPNLSKKQRNKLRRKALRQSYKAEEKERRRKKLAAAVEKEPAWKKMSQSLVVHGGKKSVPVPIDLLRGDKHQWVDANPALRPDVEREHVVNVYDSIAADWHATRYKCWPKVEAFVKSHPAGTFFGDIGCGNGKVIPVCEKVGGVIGCDISIGLLEICQEKGFETLCADCIHLPFRSALFDAVLSIAVLHHSKL